MSVEKGTKQSPEAIAKRVASRKANHLAKIAAKEARKKQAKVMKRRIENMTNDLPVVITNGAASDVEEFAEFMAAAWRIYKGKSNG